MPSGNPAVFHASGIDIAGSGRVYALNGKVTATFVKNPERSSYFGSLNGAVEVWFQPNLSADVSGKVRSWT